MGFINQLITGGHHPVSKIDENWLCSGSDFAIGNWDISDRSIKNVAPKR